MSRDLGKGNKKYSWHGLRHSLDCWSGDFEAQEYGLYKEEALLHLPAQDNEPMFMDYVQTVIANNSWARARYISDDLIEMKYEVGMLSSAKWDASASDLASQLWLFPPPIHNAREFPVPSLPL